MAGCRTGAWLRLADAPMSTSVGAVATSAESVGGGSLVAASAGAAETTLPALSDDDADVDADTFAAGGATTAA